MAPRRRWRWAPQHKGNSVESICPPPFGYSQLGVTVSSSWEPRFYVCISASYTKSFTSSQLHICDHHTEVNESKRHRDIKHQSEMDEGSLHVCVRNQGDTKPEPICLTPLANGATVSHVSNSHKNSSGPCMLSWNVSPHLQTHFWRTDTEAAVAEKYFKISFHSPQGADNLIVQTH